MQIGDVGLRFYSEDRAVKDAYEWVPNFIESLRLE